MGRDPFTSNEYLFIFEFQNQMMTHQALAKLSAGNKRVVNRTESWGMSWKCQNEQQGTTSIWHICLYFLLKRDSNNALPPQPVCQGIKTWNNIHKPLALFLHLFMKHEYSAFTSTFNSLRCYSNIYYTFTLEQQNNFTEESWSQL